MSEIEVKIVSSQTGWSGIKKDDHLKVAKVAATDTGVYVWLEDTFELDKPEPAPVDPDELPF